MSNKNIPGSIKKSPGKTGSPNPGEPVFLAIGLIRRPHGVWGEMTMEILTDFPERIKAGKRFLAGDDHQEIIISSVRRKDPNLLISIEGCEDRNSADLFRNTILYVQADQIPPLPEGEYYHHQLIGLSVVDKENNPLGIVEDIIETPANDVLIVKTLDKKEILLPIIPSVVLRVSIDEGKVLVELQEWE